MAGCHLCRLLSDFLPVSEFTLLSYLSDCTHAAAVQLLQRYNVCIANAMCCCDVVKYMCKCTAVLLLQSYAAPHHSPAEALDWALQRLLMTEQCQQGAVTARDMFMSRKLHAYISTLLLLALCCIVTCSIYSSKRASCLYNYASA
jgi:hypothetical protein